LSLLRREWYVFFLERDKIHLFMTKKKIKYTIKQKTKSKINLNKIVWITAHHAINLQFDISSNPLKIRAAQNQYCIV
jgi:hypothetical protein